MQSHRLQGRRRCAAWQQGEIPVDAAAFTKHASDVATLAGMIPEGFIPNSAVEGSAALPEIWTNMSDFQAKAADLQNAAQALATAASSQGFEAAKGMVQAVGQIVRRMSSPVSAPPRRVTAAKSLRERRLRPPFAFSRRGLLQRAFALKTGAIARADLELHLLGIAQHVERHVDARAA